MATRPKYALALKRLKDREKALTKELEDIRASISALQHIISNPPELPDAKINAQADHYVREQEKELRRIRVPFDRKPS